MAKKYSDDSGSASAGGDLGLVSKGMMVKPFEDALFALAEKGQLSKVVRSEFGYHIIKLDEIQSAKVESFEVKKATLEKELKESAVQNLFYERAEMLANLAYENPEGLGLAAEQLKLEVKKTGLFTRTAGTGIAANEKVRSVAFETAILNEKLNSDAIELTNKHVVVVRINEHKPATAKSFEQVKHSIIAELKTDKAKKMAEENAAGLLAKIESDNADENWTKLMSGYKANAKSLNLVKRDSDKADKQIIQAAFKLSKPDAGKVSFKQVAMSNGNAAVVAVTTVTEVKAGSENSLMESAKKLNQITSSQELSAVVAAIKESFEIYIPAAAKE
ncbi:MAG: peptidylprolyl isomerase [Gammaproteobacteria bacterium]|nr:peptidylprolyl isomerase [Gammaproteobacteria bacterium]